MRTRVVAWALLASLGLGLSAAPARAQTQPAVAQMTVSFWPEYDRTDVLVIYRLQLADSTSLPASLRVPVPSSVADLNAVATLNADGVPVDADYTRAETAGTSFIVVDSNSLGLQIEYYLPLPRTGDTRSFTFTWPGGLAASDFLYEVQQPVGASNLRMDPPAQGQSAGEFGLTYHQTGVGPVDASAEADCFLLVQPHFRPTERRLRSGPDTHRHARGGRRADAEPGPIPAVGVVGAGSGSHGRRGCVLPANRPTLRARRRQRHRRPGADEPDDDEEEASPVYCHNCGARASSSDRFCRRCGTQLRR